MNSFIKNNSSTIFTLAGVIAGGLCGVFLKPAVPYLKPVGDIFMNFLFVVVVPLVFLSITSSICKMVKGGSAGRTIITTLLVFLGMSVITAIFGYLGCFFFSPIKSGSDILSSGIIQSINDEAKDFGSLITGSVSVGDITMLFSKNNLLPLIVFSAIFGFTLAHCGGKASTIERIIDEGNELFIKFMGYLMKFAPIGLGCYFASVISTLGTQLFEGYARVFFLFIVMAILFFFVINSVYVLIFKGADGLKLYWRHILPPSITAMATCSSVVAIPNNIDAAKRMGVRAEIAESCIPLGTNIHKDGSVLGGVMRVLFLMLIAGASVRTGASAFTSIGIALLTSMVIGAIPGGGITGELLTCTLLGVDPAMVGIIMVIGTIIDMPATVVNSSSNVVASVIVDSILRKKNDNN